MFTFKAEVEWLGLDRVPTRLHMEESSEKQKGDINILKTQIKHSNFKLFQFAHCLSEP